MATESFNPINHLQDAVEDDIQQIIDAWEGTDPVPMNIVVNDATATALKVTNTSGGYALDVYGPTRFSSTVSTVGGPIFDVKNGYGADNTGVTAADSAFAAAIAAMPATGGSLYIPAGTYLLSGTITIDRPMHIFGDGRGSSIVKTTSATARVFNVTTTDECLFEKFGMSTAVTRTTEAYIGFTIAAGSGNSFSAILNMDFQSAWTALDMTDAIYFWVGGCNFGSYRYAGIIVDCNVADAGDSQIGPQCYFNRAAGVEPTYGILQKASGGLKIIGNKGNQPGTCFYYMELRSSAVTSGLTIVGNNIEAAVTANIAFGDPTATGGYSNITIANNKMGGAPVDISVSSAGNWLKSLNITGNNTVLGANKFVSLTGGINVLIEGNIASDVAAGSVFLENGPGSSNVRLGNNYAPGVDSWYIGPAPTIVDPDIQHGGFAAATNGAYAGGALFASADITVTFPQPFMSAPTVVATPSGAGGAYNGAISVAIKSVAADGFVCCIIGQTDVQTVTGYYSAYGILN